MHLTRDHMQCTLQTCDHMQCALQTRDHMQCALRVTTCNAPYKRVTTCLYAYGMPTHTACAAPYARTCLRTHSQQEVLQAACSILCAAGAALLPQALAGGGPYHGQFMAVAEQLLRQLTSKDMDVSGMCRGLI